MTNLKELKIKFAGVKKKGDKYVLYNKYIFSLDSNKVIDSSATKLTAVKKEIISGIILSFREFVKTKEGKKFLKNVVEIGS